MLVTAESDVTTVAIAPLPDPPDNVLPVYVPLLCVALAPVVLGNKALAVVNNPLLLESSISSATNVNFKSAFLPMALPEIVNTSSTA